MKIITIHAFKTLESKLGVGHVLSEEVDPIGSDTLKNLEQISSYTVTQLDNAKKLV